MSTKTSTATVYLLADALGNTVRSNKTLLALKFFFFFFFFSSSVDRRVTSEQTTVSLFNRRGSGCDLAVQQRASQKPQTQAVLYASSSPSTSSSSRAQTRELAAEQINLHRSVKRERKHRTTTGVVTDLERTSVVSKNYTVILNSKHKHCIWMTGKSAAQRHSQTCTSHSTPRRKHQHHPALSAVPQAQ